MPLEMNTQAIYPEVRVLYSPVAELVVLVNVLADPRHHASEQEEALKFLDQLSQASKDFLGKVAELPFQGIEFLELLLDCRAFNSVETFTKAIRGYDTVQFIHTMAGDALTDDQIAQLREDKQALPQRLSDLPWIYRGKQAVYEALLFETSAFKESLITLLQELYQMYATDVVPDVMPQYQSAIAILHKELSGNSAYTVAEKIMNRKIDADSSIKEIFFLPSYYVNPHYIMAYNQSSRLFLYDMRKKGPDKGRANQKLTSALKVLSDSTRLEILRLLILQPTYGKILADRLHLTTATISHHLDVLSSAGLIRESKDGNTKYFSTNEDELKKLLADLNDYLYNR